MAGLRKALIIAVAALAAAAVIAVAVAVPLSFTRRRAVAATASSSTVSLTGNKHGPQQRTEQSSDRISERGTSSGTATSHDLSSLLPPQTPVCNGVPGLCAVPVRLVTFPGTHNSMAIRNRETIAESQRLGFGDQLQVGARLFDIDYAGDRFGPRFGHCFSCFCSFATDPDEADPTKVFTVMADFLNAHPDDVIVLGLSNINCGDVPAARTQLLGLLAQSPLYSYLATQAVSDSTTLGDLVRLNQRVVLLFYDQWKTSAGYTVGSKQVPNQQLLRLYGENARVNADGDAAIHAQLSQTLFTDISSQLQQTAGSSDVSIPWRVLGMFPSTCLSCTNTSQCGALACAGQANKATYVLWQLGKLTISWLQASGSTALVPAFNGYQVDYLEVPRDQPGVVAAARQLNVASSLMYNLHSEAAPGLGLCNCIWLLDNGAYAGGLVCADQPAVGISLLLGTGDVGSSRLESGASGAESGSNHHHRRLLQVGGEGGRQIIVPANKQLRVQLLSGLTVQKTVSGDSLQIQVLPVDASVDALHVIWQ